MTPDTANALFHLLEHIQEKFDHASETDGQIVYFSPELVAAVDRAICRVYDEGAARGEVAMPFRDILDFFSKARGRNP